MKDKDEVDRYRYVLPLSARQWMTNKEMDLKGELMGVKRTNFGRNRMGAYFIGCAVFASILFAFSPEEAVAQGQCTGAPGEMVVGMAGGGPGGFQTPLCSSSGGGGGGAPQKSAAERLNDQISSAYTADITIMSMGLDMMKQQLDKRRNGFWEHYGPLATVERGFRSCSAVYLQGNHYLMVWGSNKPGSQATLMLMDSSANAAMQPVAVPQIQQVTLEQTGAQPATVNAIRHAFEGFGAVTFAIPSLELAVSGIQDRMSIKVTSGTEQLIAMEYNKGRAAKFWLEKCMAKLPRAKAR